MWTSSREVGEIFVRDTLSRTPCLNSNLDSVAWMASYSSECVKMLVIKIKEKKYLTKYAVIVIYCAGEMADLYLNKVLQAKKVTCSTWILWLNASNWVFSVSTCHFTWKNMASMYAMHIERTCFCHAKWYKAAILLCKIFFFSRGALMEACWSKEPFKLLHGQWRLT